MNAELLNVLDHLTREKGIDRDVVIEAIETALASAARRALDLEEEEVNVTIDRESGKIKVFANGEEVSWDGFGRIAAQTAKQVIFHKIREAERDSVFDEFAPRSGTLLTGTMHRYERGSVIVELGRTEGIVPRREQSPKETFRAGDRIRVYCVEVAKTPKGPQIILSRSHPNLITELFKLEVPEIGQGIVEIKAVAREAGDRSKIAVFSNDDKVDSVGACVGMRGTRVKDIVRELHGEKIDIIRWSSDLNEFVSSALSPAKTIRIEDIDAGKRVRVIVDDDQLSLAIGKRGQNVRLAAKLTGLDIDVRSQTQLERLKEVTLDELPNVGPTLIQVLKDAKRTSIEELAHAPLDSLTSIDGIDEKAAKRVTDAAKDLINQLAEQVAEEAIKEKAEEEGESAEDASETATEVAPESAAAEPAAEAEVAEPTESEAETAPEETPAEPVEEANSETETPEDEEPKETA